MDLKRAPRLRRPLVVALKKPAPAPLPPSIPNDCLTSSASRPSFTTKPPEASTTNTWACQLGAQ